MANRRRVWTVFGMAAFGVVLIVALTVGLVVGLGKSKPDNLSDRKFTIDHNANTFLMDGKPFRYVAGSFHYFRALPEAWNDRLTNMRAAGLNVVDTYVEWALHNPKDGVYNWEGIANIEKFIEQAETAGFYIILRPGPYICAERDNGGLPHWLFTKYPGIQLRTSDADYTREVAKWYAQLMPRLQKYLYSNGGRIIMVQVENEYGVYSACDEVHLRWLRDETEKYVEGKALLFTTDIPNERIQCGKIEGVFATTDFGIDRVHEIDEIWKILRSVQPTGPLVNSEFYPGWLTHWQEENQRRDGAKVAAALRKILEYGASVNFYMFFGGTNFGFTAGANDWGYGNYTADITSYDYDAVMDEAGDATAKYDLVREVILEYLQPTEKLPNAIRAKRVAYGKVGLAPVGELLSTAVGGILAKGATINAEQPKSFEALDQYSGLVLYETTLPPLEIDPTLLTVEGLRDRAFVYVDQRFVGTLSRENKINALPLSKGWGNKLQLLVENQGRINFNVANDTKGVFGAISLQNLDGTRAQLSNWNSTSFPLDAAEVLRLIKLFKDGALPKLEFDMRTDVLSYGPTIYNGEFSVSEIGNSYLNTKGWGKGVAYLNGLNLGRYWPLAGPQLTMYVPQEALQIGVNSLVLIEYQRVRRDEGTSVAMVQFDDAAQLDG